jgi:glyoxylate utilization-related uncharacterized protein
MPKASKATASNVMQMGAYEGHIKHLEGGYTVAFEKHTADADPAHLFKGLPDDRCQCEHWGYVISGKVSFKTAAGEETFEAGDAYYIPPGHTPVFHSDTELVEFSPTVGLHATWEAVSENLAAPAGS